MPEYLNSIPRVLNRVCTGPGKPGKSWNLLFQFPGLESLEIQVWVMKSLGKAICFLRTKRQKRQKSKKITDESETGFNYSTDRHKQAFHPL